MSTNGAGDEVLVAEGLSVGYGTVAVVEDLNLTVRAGEVVALLGPNGAGKTTTLLALAGELSPLSGRVLLHGRPTTAPLHKRSKQGLAFVPEERAIFMRLSVADNLRVAGADRSRAFELFPALEGLQHRRAGLLSGGEQQMLALARVIARRTSVLIADELSLGLAPLVVGHLLESVRRAADEQRLGILLVEQHVRKALAYADRVYVLSRGVVVLEGTAQEIVGRLAELEESYLSG